MMKFTSTLIGTVAAIKMQRELTDVEPSIELAAINVGSEIFEDLLGGGNSDGEGDGAAPVSDLSFDLEGNAQSAPEELGSDGSDIGDCTDSGCSALSFDLE